DALAGATGVPDNFPGFPAGTRAGQLPDPGLQSSFMTLFGRSDRVTACACERNGEVTLPQLLHLMNGESVIQKVASPQGRLAKTTPFLPRRKLVDNQFESFEPPASSDPSGVPLLCPLLSDLEGTQSHRVALVVKVRDQPLPEKSKRGI